MDRLGRLADANALLFQLHQVAQTLPASLDLDEVLDTTMAQLGDLFDVRRRGRSSSSTTPTTAGTSLRREGDRPPPVITTEDLPPPLDLARRLAQPRQRAQPPRLRAARASPPAPLRGSTPCSPPGGRSSGCVSIEHREAQHFTARDVELLAGFVEPAALAIDNARWFGRLRTVGADEERTRIARDLHDRIGQSLAYLAFELDRIVKTSRKGGDTTAIAREPARRRAGCGRARCATRSTTCAPTSPRRRACPPRSKRSSPGCGSAAG